MAISTINQAGLNAPLTLSSPVLTTPNLGTPSALVLTNATGTPSAINLSNATALPVTALPSGSIVKVTPFQQSSLTSATSSTTYIDSGWSFTVTTAVANSKILINTQFNISQDDTWNGGSYIWLRSISGGAYGNIAGESSSTSGYNMVAAVSGNNNRSSGASFICFDTPSVAAGTSITYKMQFKAWSSSNPLKLGVSSTNGNNGNATTTAGTQYFVFTEIAP
jgi:hypothetical protein